MNNKIEYKKIKVGNKEVESNIPKGMLSDKGIKTIENCVKKFIDKDKNKKEVIENEKM